MHCTVTLSWKYLLCLKVSSCNMYMYNVHNRTFEPKLVADGSGQQGSLCTESFGKIFVASC